MGKIVDKDFEDIVHGIAKGTSSLGGGVAAAISGIVATALTRKALDTMTHEHPERITNGEHKALVWELEDAEVHFGRLVDRDRDAVKALAKFDHDATCEVKDDSPTLTIDETYRAALSVSAAVSTSAARVLKVTARLAEAVPSDLLADVGIAAQLLYAAFIGGKMKLNHYFVHAPEMDAEFIAATRGKVYELEDEVSKLVGVSLERVWKALHPKGV